MLLQKLSKIADDLDKDLLVLEDRRSPDKTSTLTRLVTGLFDANRLSEDILHAHLPHIEADEAPVAAAIRIAHDQLSKRIAGVSHDLEVMTKARPKHLRSNPPLLRVAS